jgi:hypothetical protein
MTLPTQAQENQAQPTDAQKASDKEYNFAQMRKQLDHERQEKQKFEARLAELEHQRAATARKPYKDDDDDDDTDEPYVDEKRLKKKLSKFEENLDKKIEQKAEEKARTLIDEERRNNYLRENADFNDIMNPDLLQKFHDKFPKLTESILRMPDGFERQKLVYEGVKALGLHKKEEPKESIQGKIDQNKKNPYYMPSGQGSAPYGNNGDFSPTGQKSAYAKMQELKRNLRI